MKKRYRTTSHIDLNNKIYFPDLSEKWSENYPVEVVCVVIDKHTIKYILPFPYDSITIDLDKSHSEANSDLLKYNLDKGHLTFKETEHFNVGTYFYKCEYDKIVSGVIEKIYIKSDRIEYELSNFGICDADYFSTLGFTKAEAVEKSVSVLRSINVDSVYSQKNMALVFEPERMERIIKNNNFTRNRRHDRCWEIGNDDYWLMFYLDDVSMYPMYKFNHFVSNKSDWFMDTELYKYVPSSYNILTEEECKKCGLIDYYDVEFGDETWSTMPKVIYHIKSNIYCTFRDNSYGNLVDLEFSTLDFINFRLNNVHTMEISVLNFINFW